MKRDQVFGRPFAVLVGSMLLTVLAFHFVKSKKKRPLRIAVDIGESSSRPTSIGSNNYDVFLSFCGDDARKKFVDHLYNGLVDAGINVFKDNIDLSKGEKIDAGLFRAIKNSKISIPILSRNYGSRMYCLQELVQMIKCMRSVGHVVLPIFYGVEPAHVKFQKGDFGTTFSRFSGNYIDANVSDWKDALQEVASLLGWDSEKTANGHEGELVKEVVTKVSSELKAFPMDLTEQFVGIDDAVEDILRLLDSNPSATQIIGIHGMGGIGKTTLAKIVYKKLSSRYKHRSFLEDIRECLLLHKDKLRLQNQLISDILNTKEQASNTCDAIDTMVSRFKYKEVLIILDDVEDQNLLNDLFRKEWFKQGSRVIITTRNCSVLEPVEVDYKYKLKEIDVDQSLILFSRHAFRRDSPPPEFESLARDIVSTTEGLPLALQVIGLLLHGKNQRVWEDTSKELKKVPNETVQEKLRVSFEALNDMGKEIFLDIACFLIGTDLRIASYMWDAREFHPTTKIETLTSMSLIIIGDNHELKMHNQLRDLGQKIASQKAPRKRSRVWVYGEALEVFQEDKVNKKIEALRLDRNGSSEFMKEEIIKRLPNLQFLQLSEVDFAGDFNKSLSKLRWLKWERCPDSFKAINVHLKELLILDLSGGYISQDWEGWRLIKMERLKVLNLSGCSDLKSTPNFSAFESLEMLILEKCENLEKIDPSIGDVKGLISLNLRYCGNLEMLPERLGELKKLEELIIDETDIRKIPESMGSLEKLKTLSAVGCRLLTRVPNSIIHLVSLSTLNLNICKKLQELPQSFQANGKLQRLSLERCYMLREIPSSIGELGELVELDLSSTRIKELPEPIGKLKKLKILRISHSEIERLPSAIGKLKGLQELDASGCHKLGGQIPEDIGGLLSLKTLRLGRAKISILPKNIDKLSALEHLDLLYCSDLQSLPKPPTSLLSLQLTCRGRELPSLSDLSHLKKLTLHSCMSLQSIPALPPNIRKLRVWKCPKLETLQNLSNLKYLSELELLQCYGLKKLGGLEALKSLRKLDVSTSTELSNLDDFEDLESLRYLDMRSYDGKADHLREIGGLGQLESLKVLNISARKHIQQLDLSNSKDLKQLIVNNCESLNKIDLHDSIKSLERFGTDQCKSHIPTLLPRTGHDSRGKEQQKSD